MTIELKPKPCPHCGGEANVVKCREEMAFLPVTDSYKVKCAYCFCQTGRYSSEEKAVNAWNRRKAPEIVRCGECIYYDPPHVENNGVRYEYTEMPADAFDVLGTGLVTTEYGINIGGRCCRDYNAGYDDDKRVYVPENNFCGRAERRTDEVRTL